MKNWHFEPLGKSLSVIGADLIIVVGQIGRQRLFEEVCVTIESVEYWLAICVASERFHVRRCRSICLIGYRG